MLFSPLQILLRPLFDAQLLLWPRSSRDRKRPTRLSPNHRKLSIGANAEYNTLTKLLGASRTIITRLEKSDWFDRLLLWLGVTIFSFVVLWILKKRTIDVGISWAGWIGGGFMKLARFFAGDTPDFEVPYHKNNEEFHPSNDHHLYPIDADLPFQ